MVVNLELCVEEDEIKDEFNNTTGVDYMLKNQKGENNGVKSKDQNIVNISHSKVTHGHMQELCP